MTAWLIAVGSEMSRPTSEMSGPTGPTSGAIIIAPIVAAPARPLTLGFRPTDGVRGAVSAWVIAGILRLWRPCHLSAAASHQTKWGLCLFLRPAATIKGPSRLRHASGAPARAALP